MRWTRRRLPFGHATADVSRLDESVDERGLAERIARLPEPFQPFLDNFREYVKAEAKEYARTTPRPSPGRFKAYVAGFVKRIALPVEMVQQVVIASAYRWPLPRAEGVTKAATGLVSFGTASYGQTIAYGSAFTATAGALTVGVVGEMIELYAVASARASRYRWAGVYPGAEVIASDLQQIVGSEKLLAAGTVRHVGDEYVTAMLFELFEHAVVHSVAVPLIGPVRGGFRSFRVVGRAFDTPLTVIEPGRKGEPPADTVSAVPRFSELLAKFERSRSLPQGLGWTGDLT